MSIYSDWSAQAKRSREQYPPGTRIELLGMEDPFSPIAPGTRGTVDHVDDAGQLHIRSRINCSVIHYHLTVYILYEYVR